MEDLRLLESLTRAERDRVDLADARRALKEARRKGTMKQAVEERLLPSTFTGLAG